MRTCVPVTWGLQEGKSETGEQAEGPCNNPGKNLPPGSYPRKWGEECKGWEEFWRENE